MKLQNFFYKKSILLILFLIFNTISLTWIGYIEYLNISHPIINNLFIFYLYIIFNELWQIMLKVMYHKKKQFTYNILIIKSVISFILLLIVCIGKPIQLTLLLLIYEFYQLLLFRNNWKYIESIYYPITTSIIKGFLFNCILLLSVPFHFSINTLWILLAPIFIFMLNIRIEQQIYQVYSKEKLFNITFLIYNLLLLVVLIFLMFVHIISFIQLLFIIITLVIYFYILKINKLELLQQNLVLSICTTLLIIITSI